MASKQHAQLVPSPLLLQNVTVPLLVSPSRTTEGLLAGVAQVLVEHPLDTLKVRAQTLARADLAGLSSLAVLRHTLAHEGGRALYRGLYPRLITYGAIKASLFSLYRGFRQGRAAAGVPELGPAAAGALAGLANAPLSCAPEMVKSQCQVLLHRHHEVNFTRVAARLVAEHGFLVLFQGLAPLALRDAIGYAALFTVFESRRDHPSVPTWFMGGLAGCSFYLVSLPADRVKTVMMTSVSNPVFSSSLQAAAAIVREEGVRGFYRGLAPTLARTFLGQAVALSVYTRASALLARAPTT